MNSETQNTIQKIEESLSRQNYNLENSSDPITKFIKVLWMLLGAVLLIVTLITVTGWLTIEETNNGQTYQIQSR